MTPPFNPNAAQQLQQQRPPVGGLMRGGFAPRAMGRRDDMRGQMPFQFGGGRMPPQLPAYMNGIAPIKRPLPAPAAPVGPYPPLFGGKPVGDGLGAGGMGAGGMGGGQISIQGGFDQYGNLNGSQPYQYGMGMPPKFEPGKMINPQQYGMPTNATQGPMAGIGSFMGQGPMAGIGSFMGQGPMGGGSYGDTPEDFGMGQGPTGGMPLGGMPLGGGPAGMTPDVLEQLKAKMALFQPQQPQTQPPYNPYNPYNPYSAAMPIGSPGSPPTPPSPLGQMATPNYANSGAPNMAPRPAGQMPFGQAMQSAGISAAPAPQSYNQQGPAPAPTPAPVQGGLASVPPTGTPPAV